MGDLTTFLIVIGVVNVIYIVFAIFNAKTWRIPHNITVFLLISAVVVCFLFTGAYLMTRSAWQERYTQLEKSTQPIEERVDLLEDGIATTAQGESKVLPEPSIEELKVELQKLERKRGRLWRGCKITQGDLAALPTQFTDNNQQLTRQIPVPSITLSLPIELPGAKQPQPPADDVPPADGAPADGAPADQPPADDAAADPAVAAGPQDPILQQRSLFYLIDQTTGAVNKGARLFLFKEQPGPQPRLPGEYFGEFTLQELRTDQGVQVVLTMVPPYLTPRSDSPWVGAELIDAQDDAARAQQIRTAAVAEFQRLQQSGMTFTMYEKLPSDSHQPFHDVRMQLAALGDDELQTKYDETFGADAGAQQGGAANRDQQLAALFRREMVLLFGRGYAAKLSSAQFDAIMGNIRAAFANPNMDFDQKLVVMDEQRAALQSLILSMEDDIVARIAPVLQHHRPIEMQPAVDDEGKVIPNVYDLKFTKLPEGSKIPATRSGVKEEDIWAEVVFTREYMVEVDRPLQYNDNLQVFMPPPSKPYFDRQGLTISPQLRRFIPKDDDIPDDIVDNYSVRIPEDSEGLLPLVTAKTLADSGTVDIQQRVYYRPLIDYSHDLSEEGYYAAILYTEEKTGLLQIDTRTLEAAIDDQRGLRQTLNTRQSELNFDKQGFNEDVTAVSAVRVQVEKKLAEELKSYVAAYKKSIEMAQRLYRLNDYLERRYLAARRKAGSE